MYRAHRLLPIVGVLVVLFVVTAAASPSYAQTHDPAGSPPLNLHYAGAALGAGLIVIGAGLGIGRFTASAAEGIARQPGATGQIRGVIQLPLFLLEGVAVIGLAAVLGIVFLQ